MSDLTPCNFCTMQNMKARAEMRGVELIVQLETEGDMVDWWSARYSDQTEPSAWFMAITDSCAC